MKLWEAVVLGIVQGLTEFLPISSTAHLRIVPALLGLADPGAAFTAVIQLGTLLAVFVYFAKDIRQIIIGLLRGTDKLGWLIAVGTVPVVVFGLLFKHHIETGLRSLYVIATAMIVIALVLAVAEWLERRRQRLRELQEVGWLDAIVVGCAQAVALIPGSSRSGCTIAGGLFRGLNRAAAARFSFLLSLPAVLAAGVLELKDVRLESGTDITNLVVATVVSFVVGYATIEFLLGYLRRHTMWLFIWYRLALGAALLALLTLGRLHP
jgi:undecaprenyl-diphosphatase